MKYIKSKCLQKAKGRKSGKYLLTLEVSDYDLLMLEDFATSYAAFDTSKVNYSHFDDQNLPDASILDFKPKHAKWMLKTWKTFWKLWNKYD